MELTAEKPAVSKTASMEQKSPLYKPLWQLTEDDIVQVTREDCRRFLKEKGMRRPSWNKSQAIQQVISLKALLEPNDFGHSSVSSPPDHQKTFRFSSSSPRSPDLLLPTSEQKKELSVGGGSRSQQRRDPPVEIAGVSARKTGEALAGQMTVFYGDEVSVFDGVLVDKALAILRIAASQDYHNRQFSNMVVDLNKPFNPPLPYSVQATVPPPTPVNNVKFPGCLRDGSERKIPREFEPEGPTYRKASLQRYLEKRKDRKTFKCKRNTNCLPPPPLLPSSMDLYFTQKFRRENSNGKQCQSVSTVCPHPTHPQIPTHCTSVVNRTQNVGFSFDLNNADV
ncbi:hypothetical protein ZOSMA_95G00030 [Zostera marina]|uniref:Protein TIFY n=1 Tax=Zostera marina TaxID=29655 RepID=A0A0K9NKB0_ZOSMR|nr:hypothetical protein ZOSMA_95G00030 [Zostera marina]